MRTARKKRYINIGELQAAVDAEDEMGREARDTYYIHLQNSQVALAALVKGRSSSRSLNQVIKGSVPSHVVFNTRAFYGFVRILQMILRGCNLSAVQRSLRQDG